MKLDTILTVNSFKDVAQLARTVEDMGFDALWSLENRHEPFMPLAVAASTTEKLISELRLPWRLFAVR